MLWWEHVVLVFELERNYSYLYLAYLYPTDAVVLAVCLRCCSIVSKRRGVETASQKKRGYICRLLSKPSTVKVSKKHEPVRRTVRVSVEYKRQRPLEREKKVHFRSSEQELLPSTRGSVVGMQWLLRVSRVSKPPLCMAGRRAAQVTRATPYDPSGQTS